MGEELKPPKGQRSEWVWWHDLSQRHPKANWDCAMGVSVEEMWALRETRS